MVTCHSHDHLSASLRSAICVYRRRVFVDWMGWQLPMPLGFASRPTASASASLGWLSGLLWTASSVSDTHSAMRSHSSLIGNAISQGSSFAASPGMRSPHW